jgi:hypothetical protein
MDNRIRVASEGPLPDRERRWRIFCATVRVLIQCAWRAIIGSERLRPRSTRRCFWRAVPRPWVA